MALLRCPACSSSLPDHLFQGQAEARCPSCQKIILGRLFPALWKQHEVKPPSLPSQPQEGEAACFYSPNRVATKTCEHCGVFISDAWAAKWGDMTVCLKCIENLRTKSKDLRFESGRTLWDNVALTLVVTPLILAVLLLATFIGYFFSIVLLLATIVTAPAAIFVSLRFWKAPRSLVPRGPWRLAMALFVSFTLIGLWVVAIVKLIEYFINRSSGTV